MATKVTVGFQTIFKTSMRSEYVTRPRRNDARAPIRAKYPMPILKGLLRTAYRVSMKTAMDRMRLYVSVISGIACLY